MTSCRVLADSPTPKLTPNSFWQAGESVQHAGLSPVGDPAEVNPAFVALRNFFTAHPWLVDAGPGHLPADVPMAVAYSGGADSTALLLAASQLWPGNVVALHVHHGLQPAAEGFAQTCTAVCGRLGVPLQVIHADAGGTPGDSPEDAARRARYQALSQAAIAQRLGGVLLGQHASDQVETVLLALSRGAGLPGLSAMPAAAERGGVTFYRPLLGTLPQALREWLLHRSIPFVDDPMNVDPRYTRSRIRSRLLPALAEVFPHCHDTFARSARHAAEAQILLDELAREDLLRVGVPPQIAALQTLSRPRQRNVLRYWFRTVHQTAPSDAQLTELVRQLVACTTKGHHIEMKVARGHVRRAGAALQFTSPSP